MNICDEFLGHIRWMSDRGVSANEIAQIFGFDRKRVQKMVAGKHREYVKAKSLWTLEALVRHELLEGVK